MAKILVIDDDQSVTELLGLHLAEAGHQVIIAMDGSTGPMIAMREKPDLIILDYNLPAANGAKVHERLRGSSFTASTNVIFLTATPTSDIVTQIKNDDLTRFLQKPVNFPLLAKTIAACLGPAEPPSEPAAPPPPAEVYDPDDPNSIGGGEILDLD